MAQIWGRYRRYILTDWLPSCYSFCRIEKRTDDWVNVCSWYILFELCRSTYKAYVLKSVEEKVCIVPTLIDYKRIPFIYYVYVFTYATSVKILITITLI